MNRKELYDFYYTAITLTTGYKYNYVHVHTSYNQLHVLYIVASACSHLPTIKSVGYLELDNSPANYRARLHAT